MIQDYCTQPASEPSSPTYSPTILGDESDVEEDELVEEGGGTAKKLEDPFGLFDSLDDVSLDEFCDLDKPLQDSDSVVPPLGQARNLTGLECCGSKLWRGNLLQQCGLQLEIR